MTGTRPDTHDDSKPEGVTPDSAGAADRAADNNSPADTGNANDNDSPADNNKRQKPRQKPARLPADIDAQDRSNGDETPARPRRKQLGLVFNKPDEVTDAATGRTLLVDALLKGDREMFQALLDARANPNKTMKDGRTALHIAAQLGHVWAIEPLMRAGAAPNARDKKKRTPMFEAISAPDPAAMIEALAKNNGNADIPDADGRVPLHLAAIGGNVGAVMALAAVTRQLMRPDKDGLHALHLAAKYAGVVAVHILVQAGADPAALSYRMTTPLHLAMENPDEQVALYLLQLDAVQKAINARDIEGATPLWCGAHKISPMLLNLMIDLGAHVNVSDKQGASILFQAILHANNQNARRLAARGADIAKANPPPEKNLMPVALVNAARKAAIIDLLLEGNIDLNRKNKIGQTPLMLAAQQGRQDLCLRFLEGGADASLLDNEGRNVFHYVSRLPADLLKLFALAGADPNQPDTRAKYTPLMLALEREDEEAAGLLLDIGVDIHAKNTDDYTALHMAIARESTKISLRLLEGGASIYAVDRLYKKTPVHLAAAHGMTTALEKMMEQNPDLNLMKDSMGRTPLHSCLQNGLTSMETLRLLVLHGADPIQTDATGTTAYDLAYSQGRTLVCALFDEILAKNKQPPYKPKRPAWYGMGGYS